MAHYNLRRVSDHKVFSAQRHDKDAALFYFSIVTGEELSFKGDGPAPYLLGWRPLPGGPVDTKIPVYHAP